MRIAKTVDFCKMKHLHKKNPRKSPNYFSPFFPYGQIAVSKSNMQVLNKTSIRNKRDINWESYIRKVGKEGRWFYSQLMSKFHVSSIWEAGITGFSARHRKTFPMSLTLGWNRRVLEVTLPPSEGCKITLKNLKKSLKNIEEKWKTFDLKNVTALQTLARWG